MSGFFFTVSIKTSLQVNDGETRFCLKGVDYFWQFVGEDFVFIFVFFPPILNCYCFLTSPLPRSVLSDEG